MPEIPEADLVDKDGNPVNESSLTNQLINAEVLLPQGEEMRLAKMLKRSVGKDGELIGKDNEVLMLNTALYDVQFPDGTIKPYSANIIAENILNSVDSDGYHSQFLEGILDHSVGSNAVAKKDMWIKTKSGRRKRETTVGWKFHVKWKDGTTTWVPLKDLKESNPIEIAEYVIARGISDEPAFA